MFKYYRPTLSIIKLPTCIEIKEAIINDIRKKTQKEKWTWNAHTVKENARSCFT